MQGESQLADEEAYRQKLAADVKSEDPNAQAEEMLKMKTVRIKRAMSVGGGRGGWLSEAAGGMVRFHSSFSRILGVEGLGIIAASLRTLVRVPLYEPPPNLQQDR